MATPYTVSYTHLDVYKRQGPAQDEEFVLAHADNVEAAGFVSHLKLPHYVDFQAELELLKRLQQEQNHG